MSITATTLSLALPGVAPGTSIVTPVSMTGIVAPGPNKSNRVVLWCDREAMEVISVTSTNATVVRGVLGTLRVAHVAGTPLYIGKEADFAAFMSTAGLGPAALGLNIEGVNATTAADTATLTAAQILGGLITGTPTAAANYTTPTAALLIAALQALGVPYLNESFEFSIKNTSAGANTITVVGGTGVTIVGTATIAQNNIKRFRLIITDPVLQTINVVSLGTSVF